MHNTAHIFPAFVIKYLGKEIDYLKQHNINFEYLLHKTETASEIFLSDFDIHNNNYLKQELESQLLTYTISCGISDLLKKKKQEPELVSGFSLGIYAALYHTESLDFSDGAKLIKEVYLALKKNLTSHYKMISVIGFNKNELNKLVENTTYEIVINNGDFSFVIAGKSSESDKLIHELTNEGAIHILKFNTETPYHSSFITDSADNIKSLLSRYTIKKARYKYVSMVDQRILSSPDNLRKEIYRNIFSQLDFHTTILGLDNQGIDICFECGPGNSLTKSSKFIESSTKFISLKNF